MLLPSKRSGQATSITCPRQEYDKYFIGMFVKSVLLKMAGYVTCGSLRSAFLKHYTKSVVLSIRAYLFNLNKKRNNLISCILARL